MEKYSRWRDPGTGIQPFLPPVPPNIDKSFLSTLSNIGGYVLRPLLASLKLLLIVILALLYLVLVDVGGLLLTPLSSLRRFWRRLFSVILIRFGLVLVGFFWIPTETVSLRRGRGHAIKAQGWPARNVKSGDVIVANWTSYIDVLYLAFRSYNTNRIALQGQPIDRSPHYFTFRFDPIFTQIYPATNQLCRISLWQALQLCGAYPDLEPPEQTVRMYTLKELAKEAGDKGWGPVVVFPEATTSNGRALLKFVPIFRECKLPEEKLQLHVMAFKYEYDNFAPAYTVGSKPLHLLKLCSQMYNTLTVKYLASNDSPSSPTFVLIPTTTSHPAPASTTSATVTAVTSALAEEDPAGAQILALMGTIARIRRTGLGVLDKRDFLEYYWSRTGGAPARIAVGGGREKKRR
ncbi:hypothetical protein BC938DRAFT_481304 [Jimgerdemannia flammicorona]|uniref:Phospholipid/glycerol acyltransferase domain-containing protein n=1 Tax=Jimgerdemannia flammicorona TaxID=994334 RepID=A0A433QGD5_9FUNG|nr:hypothetical protein BC938DRAFT_481304 [Jimgerdemannia flammicorona]